MRRASPIFLARRSYRLRRMTDAARFLPVVGAFLFFLPLLWSGGMTRAGVIYLFVIWLILIVISAALSFRLRDIAQADLDEAEEGTQ